MKIVVFGASTSKSSINRALATHAAARLKEELLPQVEIEILDLAEFDLPVFSVDREDKLGVPEPAHRFFESIGSADGLIISYAEHNGHYPAAYKNLFDWASRLDQKVYQGKKAVALSTSPGGRGGASALGAAMQSATHFGCDVVASLSVPRFHSAFDKERGCLVDEALVARLDVVLRRFAHQLTEEFGDPVGAPSPGGAKWDERYGDSFVAYGRQPNDFVRTVFANIPKGPVLEVAAGEGRNAVFLAERGYEVTAMDQSSVGLGNAAKLAEERGVSITTLEADVAEFDFGDSKWAAIVATWAHFPPELRAKVHAACAKALEPGGVLILEAYSPEQLSMPGLGGPPIREMLMTPESLQRELPGLEFVLCQETKRHVSEGRFHEGMSATTQLLAVRPKP